MRPLILLFSLLLCACETVPYRAPSPRTVHYDAYGNVIGTTRKLYDGRLEHYDAYGNVTGTTRP